MADRCGEGEPAADGAHEVPFSLAIAHYRWGMLAA
jgi:hypothetical protein